MDYFLKNFFSSFKKNALFLGLCSTFVIIPKKYKQQKAITVYAWGNGIYGQLGIGTESISQSIPSPIHDLNRYEVKSLLASFDVSAALTENNELLVWGKAKDGALGKILGSSNNLDTPTNFFYSDALDAPVLDFDFGKEHGAIVTVNGTLYTWGINMYGKLGHSNDIDRWSGRSAPGSKLDRVSFGKVNFPEDVKIVSVKCGFNHTVCLTSDGEVYSWGMGSEGALGHQNFETVKTPKKIKFFKERNLKIVKIECGDNFIACITNEGKLYTWGKNNFGQLGVGQRMQTMKMAEPCEVALGGGKIAKDIYCGEDHACVITQDGEAYIWGFGLDGRLGNRNKMNSNVPTKLSLDGGKIKKVSCGGQHTAILTEEGDLYMCGNGRNGELGRGDSLESTSVLRDEPLLVNYFKQKGEKVKDVVCGSSHTIALVELM